MRDLARHRPAGLRRSTCIVQGVASLPLGVVCMPRVARASGGGEGLADAYATMAVIAILVSVVIILGYVWRSVREAHLARRPLSAAGISGGLRGLLCVLLLYAVAGASIYIFLLRPQQVAEEYRQLEDEQMAQTLRPLTGLSPGGMRETLGALREANPDLLTVSSLRYRFVHALEARLRALDVPATPDDLIALHSVQRNLEPHQLPPGVPPDYAWSQKRMLRGTLAWSEFRFVMQSAVTTCAGDRECLEGYVRSVDTYCQSKPQSCAQTLDAAEAGQIAALARELAFDGATYIAERLLQREAARAGAGPPSTGN